MKSSLWQVIALCAVIGCGVFGFAALIELGKAQELQRKLKSDEDELELVRLMPGWKEMASRHTQLRQKNPEQFKHTEEMFQQMPARMKEHRETEFQTRLSNVEERLKVLPDGVEARTLGQVTNALTQMHELELSPAEMLTSPSEAMAATAMARVTARKNLDYLHDQYVDIRLRALAETTGQHDAAGLERFVSDVRRVFADADSFTGPRMLAPAAAAKPKLTAP